MKRLFISIVGLALISMMTFAQTTSATSGQSSDPMTKKEPSAKTKKEMPAKSDGEVHKCIMDKLANSEKLKSQGFSAVVSNGEATMTGDARNAGSKGAATRIAQSCGAKSVKNNITAPAIPKPKKSEEKKTEPEKKS